MIVNLIYPYIFGGGENYKWNTVSSDYQIHETYIYVGITSATIGFFGYLFVNDRKLKKFINLCVLAFLILGFINYVPFLNSLKIPVISSFRFWGRSVILFVFSLSICVAYFINKISIQRNERVDKNKGVILIFLIYLVQLGFSFYRDKKSSIIIQQIKNRAIQLDTQFYIWLSLLFIAFSTALLVLLVRNRKTLLIKIFILSVITFDLFYFGHTILNKYDAKIDSLYNKDIIEVSKEYKNKRIAFIFKDTEYNFGLYLRSWGVLGYSQYNPTLRTKLTKTVGFKETSKQWNSEIDLTQLDRLGVAKVIRNDGITSHKFDIHSNLQYFDGIILNEESREGKYYFKIKSNQPQQINTFINNHPGWIIKVNGNVYKNKNTEDTFLTFDVPSGEIDIVIKFIPKIFYFSLGISFVGLVSLYFIIKSRNKITY
ncbi:MAG TPA: YfhO family protein [bacterium]|nr:YfhO family protein [bacterium]